MNTLGERLTYARKKSSYTQETLGESIGVSRGVIYNLEKNKTEPQEIVLNAICATLKINKDWLIAGTGDMDDNSSFSKSAKIISEIYSNAKDLSENELVYILDVIKSYRKHLVSKESE